VRHTKQYQKHSNNTTSATNPSISRALLSPGELPPAALEASLGASRARIMLSAPLVMMSSLPALRVPHDDAHALAVTVELQPGPGC